MATIDISSSYRARHRKIIFDFFGVICSEIAPYWLERYFSKSRAAEIKSQIVRLADLGKISQGELFCTLAQLANIPEKQVEEEWWEYVAINWDLVEFINAMKADHSISILTNAPAPFFRRIIREHKLVDLFDVIVVSSEEGCAKPDAEIYKTALDRLFCRPRDAIFIDDNIINVDAAKRMGICGLLYESFVPFTQRIKAAL